MIIVVLDVICQRDRIFSNVRTCLRVNRLQQNTSRTHYTYLQRREEEEEDIIRFAIGFVTWDWFKLGTKSFKTTQLLHLDPAYMCSFKTIQFFFIETFTLKWHFITVIQQFRITFLKCIMLKDFVTTKFKIRFTFRINRKENNILEEWEVKFISMDCTISIRKMWNRVISGNAFGRFCFSHLTCRVSDRRLLISTIHIKRCSQHWTCVCYLLSL